MNYRTLIRKLRALGCEYVRSAHGSHEIWWRPASQAMATIPHHANEDIPAGTLRAIIRQLGINKRDFDNA